MSEGAARGRRSKNPLTTFVGRSDQIASVHVALRADRLVTLVGVGGVGKSRLAIAVANTAEPEFDGAVARVEVGSVTDANHLPQAIRNAIAPISNEQVALVELLADRRVLVVLDGCEHLLAEVSDIVFTLLEECSGMQVLATSRVPLGLPGEHLYHVPPLALAPGSSGLSEAAQLFMARAQAVTGQPVVGSRQSVEELCARLDGLPLAIELAAIRTRTMSVVEILDGVSNRFALLQPGTNAAESRSIDATLRWSWEHCTPAQQRLWAEFSVFVGPVPLGSIADICRFADTFEAADVIDGLVARSLLIRDDAHTTVTFRMLDTIAAFGSQALTSGTASDRTADELRRAHAQYYAAFIRMVASGWFGAEQQRMSTMLRIHIPNIRAAQAYCLSTADLGDLAVGLFGDLWTFWVACGNLSEARIWSRQLAKHAPPGYEKSLWASGWAELLLGDVGTAEDHLQRCLAASAEGTRAHYVSLSLLAACCAIRGDLSMAVSEYRTSIMQAEAAEDTFALTLLTQNYAELTTILGDVDDGLAACARVDAICERHDEQWIYSYSLWVQALGALSQRRYDDAIERCTRSLSLKSNIQDLLGTALAAEVYAWASAEREDLSTAALIQAATMDYWRGTDRPLIGFTRLQEYQDRCADKVAAGLEPTARQAAVGAGKRIGIGGLARMLAERQDIAASKPDALGPKTSVLTRREFEIAHLVAGGRSNKDIADQLFISARTVETHVSNILAKLGLTRRKEIAATIQPPRS